MMTRLFGFREIRSLNQWHLINRRCLGKRFPSKVILFVRKGVSGFTKRINEIGFVQVILQIGEGISGMHIQSDPIESDS
jgi:hypothetical protein